MKKILFVCYGNQCRSPMAEYLLNDMLIKAHMDKEYRAESRGLWHRINYQPAFRSAREILEDHGIDCSMHEARPFMRTDLEEYEYIICMDQEILNGVLYIAGLNKDEYKKIPVEGRQICKLLDFTDRAGEDISDPMMEMTDEAFDKAWKDIVYGCEGLLAELALLENC